MALEKKKLSIAGLGFAPRQNLPAPMGAGIPGFEGEQTAPTGADPATKPESASTSAPEPTREVPLIPVAPPVAPAPVSVYLPIVPKNELVDRMVDTLMGDTPMIPAERAAKAFQVTIVVPTSIHEALIRLAESRQAPEILRQSVLAVAAKAQTAAGVTLKTTLPSAYASLKALRGKARAFGEGEGIRSLTVAMSSQEANLVKGLAQACHMRHIQVLEAVAFSLAQSATAPTGN